MNNIFVCIQELDKHLIGGCVGHTPFDDIVAGMFLFNDHAEVDQRRPLLLGDDEIGGNERRSLRCNGNELSSGLHRRERVAIHRTHNCLVQESRGWLWR